MPGASIQAKFFAQARRRISRVIERSLPRACARCAAFCWRRWQNGRRRGKPDFIGTSA